MRLNHLSCGVRMALVGLLAVCAVASEGTPSEGEPVTVSLRRLSTTEVVSILDKFPEIVPGHLAWVKDRAGLASRLPLSEATSAPLEAALPGVRFYKGMDGSTLPPIPYLMAIAGAKRYLMPGGFNRLLFDNGLEVNDKNVLEMARAFVILAVGVTRTAGPETGGYVEAELLSFPQIAFLDATSKELTTGRPTDAALKAKIGAQVEVWRFSASIRPGQFDFVSWRAANGDYMHYLPAIVESLPKR